MCCNTRQKVDTYPTTDLINLCAHGRPPVHPSTAICFGPTTPPPLWCPTSKVLARTFQQRRQPNKQTNGHATNMPSMLHGNDFSGTGALRLAFFVFFFYSFVFSSELEAFIHFENAPNFKINEQHFNGRCVAIANTHAYICVYWSVVLADCLPVNPSGLSK